MKKKQLVVLNEIVFVYITRTHTFMRLLPFLVYRVSNAMNEISEIIVE